MKYKMQAQIGIPGALSRIYFSVIFSVVVPVVQGLASGGMEEVEARMFLMEKYSEVESAASPQKEIITSLLNERLPRENRINRVLKDEKGGMLYFGCKEKNGDGIMNLHKVIEEGCEEFLEEVKLGATMPHDFISIFGYAYASNRPDRVSYNWKLWVNDQPMWVWAQFQSSPENRKERKLSLLLISKGILQR